jgi:hypothetical protein
VRALPFNLSLVSFRFIHHLCVALLLIAQQGALVHATWHAGGDVHAGQSPYEGITQVSPTDDENRDSQSNLCDFDLVFGQVLGGAQGSSAPQITAELPAAVATYLFNPRLGTEAVPAHSRGPPQHL